MPEIPESEDNQRNPPPKGHRRIAGPLGGLLAVCAVIAAVSVSSGWLTAVSVNGDKPSGDASANSAPEITEMAVNSDRILPRDSVIVSATATDVDGDALTYGWSASSGVIEGEGPAIQWDAPDTEGLYRVFLTVSDETGATDESSLALQVRANNPPEILVMESGVGSDVGWVVPGAPVYVKCEAEDIDGDTVTYDWSATAGEIFGQGAAIVWVAPEVLGLHWVSVTVQDSYGGSEERSLPINVNAAQPPAILGFNLEAVDTVLFRPYGDSWRIFKEGSCAIYALVVDAEGVYSYDWSAERGTLTAEGPNAVWVAPSSPKGWVNIVLKVSDAHGNQSTSSVRIYVETCPTCMSS